MTAESVEQMIAKRLDLYESGLAMTDAKTKMLNLKVRAQPNQRKIKSCDNSSRCNLSRQRGVFRVGEA